MSGSRYAFKEWAVVCQALAAGQQSLVLRKGGIAEDGGTFHVEHTRFWLYPTYVHQRADALKPDATDLLATAEAQRPPVGIVRFTHWAEVEGIYHLRNLVAALRLNDLHLWTIRTVQERFAYRSPGLYALVLRIWKAPQTIELPETAAYAGCKSWVDLDQELPTDRSTPVLDDLRFRQLSSTIERLLQPDATV